MQGLDLKAGVAAKQTLTLQLLCAPPHTHYNLSAHSLSVLLVKQARFFFPLQLSPTEPPTLNPPHAHTFLLHASVPLLCSVPSGGQSGGRHARAGAGCGKGAACGVCWDATARGGGGRCLVHLAQHPAGLLQAQIPRSHSFLSCAGQFEPLLSSTHSVPISELQGLRAGQGLVRHPGSPFSVPLTPPPPFVLFPKIRLAS